MFTRCSSPIAARSPAASRGPRGAWGFAPSRSIRRPIADALHVRLADEAHRIGPAPARESYLAIDRLIEVAQAAGRVRSSGLRIPLGERRIRRSLRAAGIVFVGPPAAAIRAMGLKDDAKALMEKAGVPVVPGYHGDDQEREHSSRQKAYEIGYPVLIKAVGRRRRQGHAAGRQARRFRGRAGRRRSARRKRRSATIAC